MNHNKLDFRCFQIGHVNLRFCSSNIQLLELIRKWLIEFEIHHAERPNDEINISLICLQNEQKAPFALPEKLHPVFVNLDTSYYTYKNLWIAKFDKLGTMIVNRQSSKILGFTYTNLLQESPWNLEHYLHPVFELIRQKKLYPHHAAAVSYQGYGLLLAGKSGQGKTTLSIDLLNKGFDYLSDDSCFLRESATGEYIDMIGFYEPFKVFVSNIEHIEMFKDLKTSTTFQDQKVLVQMTDFYQNQKKSQCVLKSIVFPQWSPADKSKLEILSPAESLIELLPLTLVCFEPNSSKAHFEFTSKLVSQVPSIRLYLGYDRESWHKLIREFISG